MKCEALNEFLNLLSEHVQTEEARGEINKIRNILKTRPDLSSRVEALCRSLSLSFTLPVIEQVYTSFKSVFREALSWCSDQKDFLNVVGCCLRRETVDCLSACLIRSILLRWFHNLEMSARWAEVAGSIAARLNQPTQMSWSQCNSSAILIQMGNDLWSKGNLRKAEVAYKQAAELWPELSDCWTDLGKVYFEQGKLHEALAMFRQALEKPHGQLDWQAWDGVADIYCRQGNLEKAEIVVRKGLETSCEAEMLYERLGHIQRLTGKPFLAITSYRRVLSVYPENARAWCDLGAAYENVRWNEAAIEAYRTSIILDPHVLFRLDLIGLFLKTGRRAYAAQELRKYLASEIERAKVAPLWVARDFRHIVSYELLNRYNIVSWSASVDKLPGTGGHIVDQYLVIAQQCLIDALKGRHLQYRDVITKLFHIGALWCLYGDRLSQKKVSKQFARERLYAVKRDLDGCPRESQMFGFASAWPELEARMEKTTQEEVAQEMIDQESKWLEAVSPKNPILMRS